MEAAAVLEMPAVEARERLADFVDEVVGALPHVRQRENALVYVRGLVEHGGRKSLQPTLFRLGESAARYESLQQFLADLALGSGRAGARLCGASRAGDRGGRLGGRRHGDQEGRQALAGGEAAVLGHAGQDRQLPDQVSVHAVGERGTLPLGWALYLPEEWCADEQRRARAKIPAGVDFQTKPQLAASLTETACGWEIRSAPILADSAYGDDTGFRTRLHELELEYVLAVSAQISVFGPETNFAVPERKGTVGRPRTVARPDRKPESVRALAARLPKRAWKTLPYRTSANGEQIESRFAFVRVVAAHTVVTDCLPPRWEWLIIEWPQGADAPSDYWLSNLPEQTKRKRLARLARLRWTIELD